MKKFIFVLIFFLLAGFGCLFYIKGIAPSSLSENHESKYAAPDETAKSGKAFEHESESNNESGGDVKNAVRSLTLSFAGDVLLDGNVATLIKSKGIDYLASDVKGVFSSSDISMLNLENPVSLNGTKAQNKQFTFRADPQYADVLTALNIDVVTLANNHSLDFGEEALTDTFDNLDRVNVKYVGAGYDVDGASKPVLFDKNGFTTAILGSSHVIPEASWAAGANKIGLATTYDPSRLLSEIEAAKKTSDLVVVYLHWGEELMTEPLDYQRNLAKAYIDKGADIVIGSHPHVLQGLEFYKGKLIAYSMGNFIFTDIKRDTMILTLKYTNDSFKAAIVPCRIENYRPILINDKTQQQDFFKRIEALSYNVRIDENGGIESLE